MIDSFSSREYITYEELTNFIEPLKITIDIPLYKGCKIVNGNCLEQLHDIKIEVLNNLLPSLASNLKEELANSWHITYIPHKESYSLGLSPKSLVETILKKLYIIDNKLPFYDLDEERDITFFKNAVLYRFKEINDSLTNNPSKYVDLKDKKMRKVYYNQAFKPIYDDLKSNIDKLLEVKDINLQPLLDKTMVYKNCLFYITLASMKELERTSLPKYSVLPKTYYEKVISPDALQWPRFLFIDGKTYNVHDFVDEYLELYKNKPNLFNELATDKLGVNIYKGSFEILPAGKINRNTVQSINKEASKTKNTKYEKLYQTKIDYYFHTNIKHLLVGTYGLKGYYGFAYHNDTVVADKLFNNPLTNTILTHNEAIYTLPSDRLEVIALDKQTIKDERARDNRILKINHDPKYNWINKINDIIERESNSICTFEEKINDLEELGLVYKCTK